MQLISIIGKYWISLGLYTKISLFFSIEMWIVLEIFLILISLQMRYKGKRYVSIALNLFIILVYGALLLYLSLAIVPFFSVYFGIDNIDGNGRFYLEMKKFTDFHLETFICLIWLIAGCICWLLKKKRVFFFRYHLLIVMAAMGIGMGGSQPIIHYIENIKNREMIEDHKEKINYNHIHNIKYTLNKYYGLYNQYPYSLDILYSDPECSKWLLLIDAFPFLEDKDINGDELVYEPIFDEEGRVFNYIFGCTNIHQNWTKPEFADYRLGIIHKISGNLKEAVACFNKIISAHPESIYARFASLKIAECRLTKEGSALELYQRVIEAYPKTEASGIALFKTGNSYFRENQYEKAIFFYQKGFEDSPSKVLKDICERRLKFIKDNSDHNYERLKLYNKAMGYKNYTNSGEAVRLWNGLVEKYPDSIIAAEALYRVATIYHTTDNDYQKAKDIYQRLIENYPDNIYRRIARCQIFHIDGNIYNLGDFVARLVNPEQPTYVKIEDLFLSVAYETDCEFLLPEELENRRQELKKIVNDILISSTPEIGTLEGKKAFKEKILHRFNDVLQYGKIEDVYCELFIQ